MNHKNSSMYDSVLYAGGVSLPDHGNCIRIGKELQLCSEESCKQKSIAEMKKVPQNLHS